MDQLQEQILALPSEQRLALIAFIATSLKEDQLLQTALERSEAIKNGTEKVLTLEELKARLYGKEI